LAGDKYFPEDKLSYEEEDLRDICTSLKLEPLTTIKGIPELPQIIEAELLRPWSVLKKARYKGSFHSVNFFSPLHKVPEFESIIYECAEELLFPIRDIGCFVLSKERARLCYYEFDFPCDKTTTQEKIERLWLKTNEALTDNGVYLAKLYGPCARIVYNRTMPTYVEKLREIKRGLDPANIMNPGKLCF